MLGIFVRNNWREACLRTKIRKKMNIYLLTTVWVLGVIVALMLLFLIISGFDLQGLVLLMILWSSALPFVLFIACSFVCGLKGTEQLYWAIGMLLVYGLLTYILLPSCQLAADPKVVHGTLKIALFFLLAFGCGYLWRMEYGHFPVLSVAAKIVVTLCAGLVLGYVLLANLRPLGGVNENFWAPVGYNAEKTLFYGNRMYYSPFPARVLGVRYYNRHGQYAGASSVQPCLNVLLDMRMGEVPDGSADILLHKRYQPMVRKLLADCKEAFRCESDRTTIYLFYCKDTLHRIEVDYYENGIISKIRRYHTTSMNEYDEPGFFDELGAPQKKLYDSIEWFRPWRIGDFRVEDTVPRIRYGYDRLHDPKLDPRLRGLLDYTTTFAQVRDSLRAQGESGDNLSIALSEAGFALDQTISIAVDSDSYYGTSHNSHFKSLPTVSEMETVCDALTLCRLESGLTERIVHFSDEYIACPRIRIKENSKRNKYMILYLLEDRAVSSDFRFRFVFDPSVHPDESKRQDAAALWQEMQQLARRNVDEQ